MDHRLMLFISLLLHARWSDLNHVLSFGRQLAACLDLPMNPIGAGNAKTATASTYRPVGASCPPCCPFETTCYALRGMVRLHQERATTDCLASLSAAALAMIAAWKAGTLARLHVSGDFMTDGVIDDEYIYGLAELGQLLHEYIDDKPTLAWSYTHISQEDFEPYRLVLKAAGIEVLYSGSFAVGGAVVWPFEDVDELREAYPTQTFAKCRFDLDGTLCRDCGLCPDAWQERLTIVFNPTGGAMPIARNDIVAA